MAASAPAPARIQRILDRLDAFIHAAGTVAIHDALYSLLQDPDGASFSSLSALLGEHRDHPLHGEIQAELGPWLTVQEQTLEGVLAEDGPLPPDLDPVQEVRRRLLRAREVRTVLQARISTLEHHGRQLNNTANGMAAVAAFLAVFALMGWLAALGLWEIPWLAPPELEPPDSEEEETVSESE